ncbi:MAG: glycoside hydrolase family 78 protein, partial [Lachnospiraceae bacterium]|nr:glycoside hydrolase family 78 protein [Lachnospiraceae bacterium]
MKKNVRANWICPSRDMGNICPVFRKEWKTNKEVKRATLVITALGVYEARLYACAAEEDVSCGQRCGKRIGGFVLAPGWTAYDSRLQVQSYDITEMLRDHGTRVRSKNNGESGSGEDEDSFEINKESRSEPYVYVLTVTVGKGWFRSPMPGWLESPDKIRRKNRPCGLIAEIQLEYIDGTREIIPTDSSWQCAESAVRFSEIYDGETFDACCEMELLPSLNGCGAEASAEFKRVNGEPVKWEPVEILNWPKEILIEQEGEEIREQERIPAKAVFQTPKGELVVDFGQEVTGYVELSMKAQAGERVRILHGEVLDKDGNFYNANYRSAKAEINYICKDGYQIWHPKLTFFGFRYLKLVEFPGMKSQIPDSKETTVAISTERKDLLSKEYRDHREKLTAPEEYEIRPEQFTAIVIYSNIRQTGHLRCSDPMLNQLFSNIFRGQRGNFLDVPTDCPQRDERLGWTGDAQVFVKTASYNYDVETFFRKWLRDLSAEQRGDGSVGQVIPDYLPEGEPSAAWGDAAVICPWQIYLTYGNPDILAEQFESMKKWVDYITTSTDDTGLWTGGTHFGDWLGLDAPSGSYKGSSREDFIASAFYAHSTALLVKAGHVLGKEMSVYESLYYEIVRTFRKTYTEYRTQTEHILAVQFGLAEDAQATADALAATIQRDGCQMKTGFVGTPYLLHVLSDFGHNDLAYTLLLRNEYPSWLYSVGKGATTIWEHWDGIMEDGSFWSTDMNSFNHYAYGSVADWIYEKAAGIQVMEDAPGFAKVRIEPHPDQRIDWLEASIDTRHGKVSSRWSWVSSQNGIREDISSQREKIPGKLFGKALVQYEISVEMPAELVIDGKHYDLRP